MTIDGDRGDMNHQQNERTSVETIIARVRADITWLEAAWSFCRICLSRGHATADHGEPSGYDGAGIAAWRKPRRAERP